MNEEHLLEQDPVVPGAIYRHVKTRSYYKILDVALESTNIRAGTDVVVYLSLSTGRLHVRDLAEFTEAVPCLCSKGCLQMVPRFRRVPQVGV